MRELLPLLTGALTVLIFLGIGTSLLVSHRWAFGGLVLALAVYRAVRLLAQWRSAREA